MRQAGAALRCGVWASHCGGFSCEALALGCVGFSSCRSWILECTRFSSCGTELLHGMGNLTEPGIEPVSPALVGRFLTTGQPGKSLILHFKVFNSPVSFHYGLIYEHMIGIVYRGKWNKNPALSILLFFFKIEQPMKISNVVISKSCLKIK